MRSSTRRMLQLAHGAFFTPHKPVFAVSVEAGLMEMLSRSREESLQTDERRKASIDTHRRIVSAIEKHDRTKARIEMQRHIEQVEASVLPVNRENENEPNRVTEERRIS